jgi:hypothetical protein
VKPGSSCGEAKPEKAFSAKKEKRRGDGEVTESFRFADHPGSISLCLNLKFRGKIAK